jgi:hypothetical protein
MRPGYNHHLSLRKVLANPLERMAIEAFEDM